MRIGIVTPVLTRVPGAHNPWEATEGIETVARIAETADRLGFHHLTCSEHVGVPTDVASVRGATYWDPLATFGFLAARTRQIRFATQVLVLGYHHPLAIAKRYGTLDAVSGGRLILGLGVGTLREEFALLDAEFAGRGDRADDALRALRTAWAQRVPEYHGTHYDFSDMVLEPAAVQADVPFWIGGQSARSLRRATELGTGWVPFGIGLDDLRTMLDAAPTPPDFEVILSSGVLDPAGDAAGTHQRLERVTAAGATIIGASLKADDPQHYLEQLAALAEIAGLEPTR